MRLPDGVVRVSCAAVVTFVPPTWLAVAACFWTGCATPVKPRPGLEGESAAFVRTHFEQRPGEAVALGWHEHDGRIVVPTREAMNRELSRLRSFEVSLRGVREAGLSDSARLDLQLLRLAVRRGLWSLETEQGWRRNPMFYAGALDVSLYIRRDFKPLRERVADMASILRHAPGLFAAARANLDLVLPRPFVETGIEVARGTAAFLEREVLHAARTCGDPRVLAEFEAANSGAARECRAFAAWLEAERLPASNGAFALGREGYVAMLRAEGVEGSPEEILAAGLRELAAEQSRFGAAAREIDATRPAAAVFKAIQRDHPTASSLIPDTRRNLEVIREFVVSRRLVTIPSEVRARVEATLPPFRATSFASMDTPGPFETRATEAYYYVTPVEPGWSEGQAEEWLSAFNYYTTDVVSIHEAYPGHYVQFLALNASRATTVQKVFPSYAFSEGWAHYAEQMVLEAGFMQPPDPARCTAEERVRAAKYRLAQSDEALLRLCRLCCSVRMHCDGMTVDEATAFFREQCHYEEKPARSEATRGTYDPGYLFYTLGKMQILALRDEARRALGDRFDLGRFHDELLAHGAPPPALLRPFVTRRQRD